MRTTPAFQQRPLVEVAGDPLRLFNMGANATRTSWHQDPVSGLWFPGALLEPTRTQLCKYNLRHDQWATLNRVTVPTTDYSGPVGATADVIHEDNTLGTHHVSDTLTANMVNGTVYAVSTMVKAINRPWAAVAVYHDGATHYACARLDTGALGAASGLSNAHILPMGDGWYLLWATKTATTTGVSYSLVHTLDSNDGFTFTGANQDSLAAVGTQVEAGLYPSSLIENPGVASVQRTADSELRWGTYVPDIFTCQLVLSIPSHTPATETDVFYIDDGTANNRIVFAYDTSRKLRVYCKVGGVTKADVTPDRIVTDDGVHRVAVAYGRGRISVSVDGVGLNGYGDHVPGMNAIAIQPSGGLCSLQWRNEWLTGQPQRVQPDLLVAA